MQKNTYNGPCACQDTTVLALNRTAVSRLVAVGSLVCFFIFVAGYFWGKKHATESFMSAVAEEATVDRLQVSLNTIAPVGGPVDSMVDAMEETTAPSPEVGLQEQAQEQEPESNESGKKYSAQLVGFGTARNADQFIKKLARHGISEVEVSSRTSRMNGGKKRTWYQVVTKPFADHQRVVALVDRIKQVEKLHDVRIIAQNT